MEKPLFRWGILGAAQIARKNWKAVWNSGNGAVAAVASRSVDRAREFIGGCQAVVPFPVAPRAMGSYEEMVESPDLDGFYIPLPTGIRKEWVLRAARAGKHVVCEKPCAVRLEDLGEMIEACRQHGVQFMDGVMFSHSRRLDMMRQALADPDVIGPIRRIESAFSFRGDEDFFRTNIRAAAGLEPHGCLGDLGWYCIRFALWVMEGRLPRQVRGQMIAASPGAAGQGIPADFSGDLLFDGGVSSGFYCSFLTALRQSASVSGTRGSLELSDFVLPWLGCDTRFETCQPDQFINGCDFNMEPRRRAWSAPEYSHSHPSAQETNLFRDFAAQAQSGGLNQEWPAMAFKTQQVMEACRASSRAGGMPVELAPAAGR